MSVSIAQKVAELEAEHKALRAAAIEVITQHQTEDGMHARLLSALRDLDHVLIGAPVEPVDRHSTTMGPIEGVSNG